MERWHAGCPARTRHQAWWLACRSLAPRPACRLHTSCQALLPTSCAACYALAPHTALCREQADLAGLFEAVEGARAALRIADYSITQATLEQVFIAMAAPQYGGAQHGGATAVGAGAPSPFAGTTDPAAGAAASGPGGHK